MGFYPYLDKITQTNNTYKEKKWLKSRVPTVILFLVKM